MDRFGKFDLANISNFTVLQLSTDNHSAYLLDFKTISTVAIVKVCRPVDGIHPINETNLEEKQDHEELFFTQ